jgi:hypothetical protein
MEVIEGVRVAAVHGPGGCVRPVWFELERKQHRILEVTNSWREKLGREELIYFHVSDGGALYELVYHPVALSWKLQRIEALL